MKQMYKLFVCCCLFITTVNAQDALDCDFNFREALIFLEGSEYVERDSLKAIQFLTPCVALANADAQTLMARLYLNSRDEKDIARGFRLTKKASKQDHALATHDLGVLYKYGKGHNQDLKKAVKWFKKSHELGNAKAAYSLGYMYFKGFGGLDQNYKKATNWFKRSDYAMATHWLAVSYYFGYGVKENKSKALKLLDEKPFEGSDILLNALKNTTQQMKLEEAELFLLNELKTSEDTAESEMAVNDLQGNWAGSLIQLDWSKSMPVQKIPVSLSFVKDSVLDDVSYHMQLKQETYEGEVTNIGNTMYFENMNLTLEHPFRRHLEKNVAYTMISNKFLTRTHKDDNFLILSLETFIENWQESGAPLVFVLKKEKAVTENNVELSDAALEALEAQNSFVKLYPNPFENDLIIAYELDAPGNVSVKLTSIDGSTTALVKNESYQGLGTYRYHFNGSALTNGVYVIAIIIDGVQKTKMIVKN